MLQHNEHISTDVLSLDPLLAALTHFKSSAELKSRLKTLFEILDRDNSKSISYKELAAGLRELRIRPRIQLSSEEFDSITQGRKLLNEQGELGFEEFEACLRYQLKLYVQRFLTSNMTRASRENPHVGSLLFALKYFTQQVDMAGGNLWGSKFIEDKNRRNRRRGTLLLSATHRDLKDAAGGGAGAPGAGGERGIGGVGDPVGSDTEANPSNPSKSESESPEGGREGGQSGGKVGVEEEGEGGEGGEGTETTFSMGMGRLGARISRF